MFWCSTQWKDEASEHYQLWTEVIRSITTVSNNCKSSFFAFSRISHWAKITFSGSNSNTMNLWRSVFILWALCCLNERYSSSITEAVCTHGRQKTHYKVTCQAAAFTLKLMFVWLFSVQELLLQVVRGAASLWCTWATVMAHFFASSSLASSLG